MPSPRPISQRQAASLASRARREAGLSAMPGLRRGESVSVQLAVLCLVLFVLLCLVRPDCNKSKRALGKGSFFRIYCSMGRKWKGLWGRYCFICFTDGRVSGTDPRSWGVLFPRDPFPSVFNSNLHHCDELEESEIRQAVAFSPAPVHGMWWYPSQQCCRVQHRSSVSAMAPAANPSVRLGAGF